MNSNTWSVDHVYIGVNWIRQSDLILVHSLYIISSDHWKYSIHAVQNSLFLFVPPSQLQHLNTLNLYALHAVLHWPIYSCVITCQSFSSTTGTGLIKWHYTVRERNCPRIHVLWLNLTVPSRAIYDHYYHCKTGPLHLPEVYQWITGP